MSSPQIDEIRSLIQKGTRRLNKFFYAGVVIGTLMGPGVLIALQVPAVQMALKVDAANLQAGRIFGWGMTVLFAIAIVEQLAKARKNHQLVWLLKQSPRDVVWAYKEISTGRVRRRFGGRGIQVGTFYHIRFHLVDKKQVIVWLSEGEADRLMALVAAEFPYITTGYSEEIERVYKEDPLELRLNPRHVPGVKQTSASVRYS